MEVRLDSDRLATLDIMLDYEVVDARDMPFKDRSQHIILKKGTLDAMLSDKDHGVANCVKIINECARILTINGKVGNIFMEASKFVLNSFIFRIYCDCFSSKCSHRERY